MRAWLLVEYLVLFVGFPALFASRRLPVSLILVLWLLTVICLVVLLNSPRFERRRLWNATQLQRQVSRALLPLIVAAPFLILTTLWLAPERFLGFVQTQPLLWAAVMLLYPVLSAYPQGIVYRVFIFHRYRELFPGRWSILASAAAFAVAHVVMQNWIAPVFSLVGGALFAWTYDRTQSALVAAVQHAAFGCFLFTVGLGWYFYYGSVG